ncbi:MAG: hypothetical protein GY805_39390 [Chloroflexi bacterium]|nr:hypothetical protein [Chloroflexota bacterium]
MSHSIDFEALKKKLYLSYHQDGILDLVIGLSILGFGINMYTDSSAFIVLSWFGIMLYAPLKARITIPRMGYVQFDEVRTRKTKQMVMLAIGMSTFSLFLGLFVFVRSDNFSASFSQWFEQYYLLVLGAFPAIILAGAALWLGVNRLLLHALLIVGIIYAGIQLDVPEPYYVMVLGGIISLVGLWLLVRFLQKYPKKQKENDDALR